MEDVEFFSTLLMLLFRKKNRVPITWEPGLVSLELRVSFIIHSRRRLPLELTRRLLPLPPQLLLHQVFHMLAAFLHGRFRECRIYLDRAFNLMCLLLCLLHKALCLRWAGATTWLVRNCWMKCLFIFVFFRVSEYDARLYYFRATKDCKGY